MSDRDDFMAWLESHLKPAEIALHNGDAAPRRAVWSRRDPVTLFGAVRSASGPQEIDDLFAELATKFSDYRASSMEIVAADVVGDFAYTAAYEHTETSVDGEARTYTLRVTQIYRREDGEWKVAHRHGDTVTSRSD